MQVVRTRFSIRNKQVASENALHLSPESWHDGIRFLKSKLLANPRQTVSVALIVTGTALSTWVAASYAFMYWEQHELLNRFSSNRTNGAMLTKLVIPRIHLEDVVLEGASSDSLLLGPAHLADTAEPGETGNTVIAGHRDTFFRHVHSLRKGDDIYVFRAGRKFHYIVRTRKIVEPTDLAVLKPSSGGELTLITCYPTHVIGPAPLRLIIVAEIAPANRLQRQTAPSAIAFAQP